MGFAESVLPEFDQEMANTRKVLEQVPEDKMDWKPHPKSNTIGWNANHLAEMAGWVEGTLNRAEWEIAPEGGERYQMPELKTRAELLALFDGHVKTGRAAIEGVKDEALGETWRLLEGGKPLIEMPRGAVYRVFIINHMIHHRAHLISYLRMNDVPVPGMYGPSGDD